MRAGSPSRAAQAERRSRAIRRRRAVLLGGVAALALAISSLASGGHATRPGVLVLRSGGAPLVRLPLRPYVHGGRFDRSAAAAAALRLLPATATVTSGRARIDYAYDRSAAARALTRPPVTGAVVEVPRRAVAATIDAPVITQREPNDCEATALSIVLATASAPSDQLALQAELPRSGPLDPTGGVWGDPDLGFVGRPEGGGFGVYQRPVAQVAARHGLRLADLTGSPPAAVYARLLAGRPVIAWVGLTDGPYRSWRSPTGRPIAANFGEHAVVLAGIDRGGALSVRNPLDAAPETWTRAQFELMWARLGRRALAA
jgi:uncharacterized protein YvpB